MATFYWSVLDGPFLAKVPYFFFRGKVYMALTHSISVNFDFFSSLFGKKLYKLFFFPRKSLEATHSIFFYICRKRSKKGKLYSFLKFFSFWRCFFFPTNPKKKVFYFFSQEKFTRHSLTQSQEPEKKTAPKKKTAFSLTHSNLPKNGKS